MGWPHLASCRNINMWMNTVVQRLFVIPAMGNFHPRVSFTAQEPARFWFLAITLFPDNKSVQPLFIALHLTKEINVYFVCQKSTNSIEGMTNETLTQELVHTFNHTGRKEGWLCCPSWMMPKSITSNRNKNWPNLQAYSWQENSSISWGSWFVLCTQKCSAQKSPHLPGPPAAKGSWLDPGPQHSIARIPQRIHPSLWY